MTAELSMSFLDTGFLSNVAKLTNAKTRSICAENPNGAKGRGRAGDRAGREPRRADAWQGLEGPAVHQSAAESTTTLAEIEGPGIIQHIWITVDPNSLPRLHPAFLLGWRGDPVGRGAAGRFLLLRARHADQRQLDPGRGEPQRRVQLLLADAVPQERPHQIENQWQEDIERLLLPGRPTSLTRCRKTPPTSTRSGGGRSRTIDNPEHVILDGIKGKGHYVGTYLAWTQLSNGWWGEGEIKFFMDGDKRVPDDLRHGHRGLLRRRVGLSAK